MSQPFSPVPARLKHYQSSLATVPNFSNNHYRPNPPHRPSTTPAKDYRFDSTDKNLWEDHQRLLADNHRIWPDSHRSISTFGSTERSVAETVTDITEPDCCESVRPKAVSLIECIQKWVGYGTYGSVEECERLGDISPYNYAHLYVAHKFDNTLELRRRGLLEAIENVDSLFSFNLSSSQEHTGCSSTHGQNTVPSRVPTHDYPNGNNTQSAAQHLTTAPTRKKRRRQGEEEEEDADDKRREDKDDRGPAPPKRPEMREVFKCFTPDERCEGLMFPDLDRLLHHMCQFHLSARCCPICEEKFHFNRERNKWTLHHGKSPKNQSGFKFFFRNDQDMKWHILRQHICPYRCPVCPDSKRFEGRQLRKHLKEQHPGATFDQQNIFKEASNLGIYELTQLTAKFLGVALTKAQMKRFLYWDGRKIYDFEDGHSSMNTVLKELWPHQELALSGDSSPSHAPAPVSRFPGTTSSTTISSGSNPSFGSGHLGAVPPAAFGHPMSPNIASGEPVTPQPLQSERTYNTTPGYPAEQLPGSGPSPQVLGSTAEASNREPQQTPRPNGPVHSPDVNEPSHPDTLFAAPGMDELKEVFNLTEEDLQKLQLAGWQLRGDVLDLIRCYHRVEAHCRLISSNNNACAASQKPSAEELMLVIAKMLWNEDCNSLSTAIVNHRAELRLAAETAFSGPVLPNYRNFPQNLDSGYRSGPYAQEVYGDHFICNDSVCVCNQVYCPHTIYID